MKNSKMHSFNVELKDGDILPDDMVVSPLLSYIMILVIIGCVRLEGMELYENLNKNICKKQEV